MHEHLVKLISSCAVQLNLSTSQACVLLRHCKWNVEVRFDCGAAPFFTPSCTALTPIRHICVCVQNLRQRWKDDASALAEEAGVVMEGGGIVAGGVVWCGVVWMVGCHRVGKCPDAAASVLYLQRMTMKMTRSVKSAWRKWMNVAPSRVATSSAANVGRSTCLLRCVPLMVTSWRGGEMTKWMIVTTG